MFLVVVVVAPPPLHINPKMATKTATMDDIDGVEEEMRDSANATTSLVDEDVLADMLRKSCKRTFEFFLKSYGQPIPLNEEAAGDRLACKLRDEYELVRHLPPPKRPQPSAPTATQTKPTKRLAPNSSLSI